MKPIIAAACLVLAAACTMPIHTTSRDDNVLRVWSDGGGFLEKRLQEVDDLRARGTRVEIWGPCASACVLYLGLPNTYVHPNVQFGFHGSAHILGLQLEVLDSYDAIMALHLPGPIRDKFWDEWRHMQFATYQVTATELKEIAPNHVRFLP